MAQICILYRDELTCRNVDNITYKLAKDIIFNTFTVSKIGSFLDFRCVEDDCDIYTVLIYGTSGLYIIEADTSLNVLTNDVNVVRLLNHVLETARYITRLLSNIGKIVRELRDLDSRISDVENSIDELGEKVTRLDEDLSELEVKVRQLEDGS